MVWLGISSLGAFAAVALVLASVVATYPLYPQWVVIAVFVAIFPVQFRTVFAGRDLMGRARFKKESGRFFWPWPVPRWLAQAILAAYAAEAALVLLSLPTMFGGGNPERHGRGYYLDDHGALTQVSESRYYAQEIAQDRGFLGVASLFFGLGAGFNLKLLKKSDRYG